MHVLQDLANFLTGFAFDNKPADKMPNASGSTADPIPIPVAKGHMALASIADTMTPSANRKVPGSATFMGGGSSIPPVMANSRRPKPKTKSKPRTLLVMPLNHTQVRAVRPTATSTTKPVTTQGPTADLRPATAQASAFVPPPSPKGAITALRPANAQGTATDAAGARCIPATQPSSAGPMQRTGALGAKPVNHQGSQPQAVRPPTQGSATKPLPAQRPTATMRPATAQAVAGVRNPPSPKGPTSVLRPADTQGPATTNSGGHRIPSKTPNSSLKEPNTMRRPATIQEPTTMTTLNPAAPVFVPSSKGHKTLATAAAHPSGDKKIPAPAVGAGGRRIPAIRPPSARPVPRAGARAVDMRPISRPPAHPQWCRPVAIEMRPIGRQGFPAMPRPPTAQWPVMVRGAIPTQGDTTAVRTIAARHPCSLQSQARVPPTAAKGTTSMPPPAATQASAGVPTFVPMGTIDMPRPVTAQGSAVPQQGYPIPPDFRPVRPVIWPGRVDPFAHLFNGETPQDKVWPRTFGPGQPHTASIIHKLQDQEFLPQSGWWCWLPFEGRYDLMPYY